MDNIKHTANFLASFFLLSKRSLKKIYNLNPTCIAILRYICDSIDLNYKSKKKFHTKLYQSQIEKFCHCSQRTVRDHIHHLVKKRLIKYNDKKCLFEVGQILLSPANSAGVKEGGKFCREVRRGQNLPVSNVSNFPNKNFPLKTNNQKPNLASVNNQSTTFKKQPEKRSKPPKEWKDSLKSIKQKAKG